MSSDHPDPSPESSSAALRPDMVEAARQFMSTPKVRGTPFEEQRKFLLEKGLTEAEITEAAAGVQPLPNPVNGQVPYQMPPGYYQPPPPGIGTKLYNVTQSAVVIGGAGYLAYRFVKTWVLPKFFNVPNEEDQKLEQLQQQVNELQNSTKFIMDSVEQTLQLVSTQQQQLSQLLLQGKGSSRADNDLIRVASDVAVVKSLLLNQNQFPPIPTAPINGEKQAKSVHWHHPTPTVPAWQLANGNGTANGVTSVESDEHTTTNGLQNDDEFVEALNDTPATA
uniref:Peroxisomal membrane protein PEX14 n=1 Tax=Panagrellus redivivus TaxID=6233 RepID=A0A7E4UND3_PANRE